MKIVQRALFAATLSFASLAALPQAQAALLSEPFDGASNFSLIVTGNAYFGNGAHVHGGGFIGGNLSINGSNGGFGQDLPSNDDLGLFVGGNIATPSGGLKQIALFNQRYYLGGTNSGAYFQNAGAAYGSSPLVDSVAQIKAALSGKGAELARLSSAHATVNASDPNQIRFNLVAGELNVINLNSSNASFLSNANSNLLFNNFTDGTKVVINYDLSSDLVFKMKNQNLSTALLDDVVWNFTGSGKLTFDNSVSTFKGAIFAPDATVEWNANDIDGQLVAGTLKWSQTSQSHFYTPWTPFEPIPEPSTYGLIGAGFLLLLVAYRRFRGRRA